MTKLDHEWVHDWLRLRLADGTLQDVLDWVESKLPIVETACDMMHQQHRDNQIMLAPYDVRVRDRHTYDRLRTIRRRLLFLQSRLRRMIKP